MKSLHEAVWRHEENERIWRSYVRYLKRKGRSDHTVLNYFKSIHRLDESVVFTRATALDLEDFFDSELNRVAVSSVHNTRASLRAFFRWLQKQEHITLSPMVCIELPNAEDKAPTVLTDSQLKSLIAACKGKLFIDKRDEAIVRLMSEPGGPRLGEMFSLSVSDVDWRLNLAQIKGKTGTRQIAYGDRTADALENYLRIRNKQKHAALEAMWICNRGRLGYYSFRAMLARRCRQANIPVISNKILRHTSADRSMSDGISDLDMQTLFGWSSPAMLAVYGRSNRNARALASARKRALGDRI